MKKTIIIILSILPLSIGAQQKSRSSFDANAGFYADAYDVVWIIPEDMIDMDTTVNRRIKKEYRVGNVYEPVLESENRKFILMYAGNVFLK